MGFAIPIMKTVSSFATLTASFASPVREACVGTRITALAAPLASACPGCVLNDHPPLPLTLPLLHLPLQHLALHAGLFLASNLGFHHSNRADHNLNHASNLSLNRNLNLVTPGLSHAWNLGLNLGTLHWNLALNHNWNLGLNLGTLHWNLALNHNSIRGFNLFSNLALNLV